MEKAPNTPEAEERQAVAANLGSEALKVVARPSGRVKFRPPFPRGVVYRLVLPGDSPHFRHLGNDADKLT